MVFLSIKCRICRYFLIQLLVCKMSWNLSLKFCFSGVGHYSAGTAGRYRKEKEGGRLLGGRKWPRLRGLCKKIAFWALSLLLSKYKAMQSIIFSKIALGCDKIPRQLVSRLKQKCACTKNIYAFKSERKHLYFVEIALATRISLTSINVNFKLLRRFSSLYLK